MVRRARGQAMVELVVSGICCLLFLGIWYLGKFHDLQATTIQAARYAAWERTAQSSAQLSDAQLGNQLRARLFSWNRDAYKHTDSKAPSVKIVVAGFLDGINLPDEGICQTHLSLPL